MSNLGGTKISEDTEGLGGPTGATGATGAAGATGPVGNVPLTTKGDVMSYDTDDQRVAVGTNGQVLTADSAEATGIKWATPSTGSAPDACRLVRSSGLAADGNTILTYETEDYDDNSFADIGTNDDRFIIPTGVTRINFSCEVLLSAVNTNQYVRLTLDHLDSGLSTILIRTMQSIEMSLATPSISFAIFGLTVSPTDVIRCRILTEDTSVIVDSCSSTIQDVTP